jgi:hypothetical protein
MGQFTTIDRKGKVSARRNSPFLAALELCDPYNLNDFNDFLGVCENLVKGEHPEVKTGALNNVRGAWYEWLIAIHAIKFASENNTETIMVKLPNISSFDCAELFCEDIYKLIEDLRKKVNEAEGVRLITSNPDFCFIKREIVFGHLPDLNNLDSLAPIDQLYLNAKGLCALDDIRAYAATKTSLRSDRRFQISHEGSLMKALYKHIQTRNWLIEAPGISYYAFMSEYSPADEQALNTVATHSITDVSSKPQSAVDSIFSINSSADIFAALAEVSN